MCNLQARFLHPQHHHLISQRRDNTTSTSDNSTTAGTTSCSESKLIIDNKDKLVDGKIKTNTLNIKKLEALKICALLKKEEKTKYRFTKPQK